MGLENGDRVTFDENIETVNNYNSARIFLRIDNVACTCNLDAHQENMSVNCIRPQTPLLYSKTGVCRGIPIFLIFAPKHRLWVPVRTASARRF